MAETWSAQSSLEEAMNNFKVELAKVDNPNLIKLGEQIEITSNDLKMCITNAIKQIDATKLQIIKILEMQDNKIRKGEMSMDRGH